LVLALIAVRLVWGLIGTRHARFSDFVRKPSDVLAYVRDALRLRAPRYLGHNPAGGAMVIALMIAVVLTGLSGLAVYGAEELSGPLAPLMSALPGSWGHFFEEVHEVMANLTLVLIVAHVAGVIFSSLSHRENLIGGMITGLKRRDMNETDMKATSGTSDAVVSGPWPSRPRPSPPTRRQVLQAGPRNTRRPTARRRAVASPAMAVT
jgi:cytochrome b